jgi:sec-independent protein translocase protein TatB
MFGLSIEKIVVLVVVALFVLGPERLPAAAAWLGKAIRQVKGFAAAANEQIHAELGPELDQLRQPLAELRAPLQELRALRDPRAAIMRHLLAEPVAASEPVAGAVVLTKSTSTPTPPVDVDAT